MSTDDFFEKSRNLQLKDKIHILLTRSPIDFVAIINEARELTVKEAGLKPPNYKQRNYMAETMYGNVIGILHDNHPEYMKIDDCSRPYILLEKNVRVYIKKLTENYAPNNIKTQHVKAMDAQDLFTGDVSINVLYAGFILNMNDWALPFRSICISYLNKVYNKQAAWTIDLNEEHYRKSTSIITYLNTHIDDTDSLVKIPKQVSKDKSATG